jgi:dihydropteroate synthase
VIRSDNACLIGDRQFRWSERTLVMGIVNVTPDSFSGDGLLPSEGSLPTQVLELAVSQALAFVEQGADIVDIGGESTRPGSVPVDENTELSRVLPVIEQLRAKSDIPISIDTYKAAVARRALDSGASLVNDIWGLQMDPLMAPLIAERSVPVVIMHNRSRPKDAVQQARLGGRYIGSQYADLVADIVSELDQQVSLALRAGIARERIIIDPGIGFGKTVEQNMRLMNHLDALQVLDLPILLGTSRKSFIGYTLDLPPEERIEGTIATVVLGIARGANIVRVHDVLAVVRAVRMTDAILRAV